MGRFRQIQIDQNLNETYMQPIRRLIFLFCCHLWKWSQKCLFACEIMCIMRVVCESNFRVWAFRATDILGNSDDKNYFRTEICVYVTIWSMLLFWNCKEVIRIWVPGLHYDLQYRKVFLFWGILKYLWHFGSYFSWAKMHYTWKGKVTHPFFICQ